MSPYGDLKSGLDTISLFHYVTIRVTVKNKRIVAFGFLSTIIITLALLGTTLSAETKPTESSRFGAINKFINILGIVEKYYVDEVSFDELINKAIKGLLSNLDAHSGYLNEKDYKELQVATEGEFGGLGITVGMRNDLLTVISPIDDTPAYRAGIKAGDVIIKIDNQSTMNMNIDDAVALMRGKPGTKVTLTIYRKSEPKPLVVEITRAIINVQSVAAQMLDGKILYIRITNFDKKVAESVRKEIERHKNAAGLILDLRNNPGGLLDQAVELVDLFIEKGVIVSQKGRVQDENIVYEAKKDGTLLKDKPMVVLINEGSASASEIVSGALQDHKRAVIVGEKSFGKGSVQVILPVENKEAIRLTIARYYLPSGRTIQSVGVTPDVVVHQGVVKTEENGFSVKENELKDHLKSEIEKIEQQQATPLKNDENQTTEPKKSIVDIDKDLQLQTAIGIIKALIVHQKQ
ncbi:MAG: S41 family peptidase [Campylobacterales bacterium]